MRAKQVQVPGRPPQPDLIVSARPDRQPILGHAGPGSRYTFTVPRVVKCRASRGSHAGLDQLLVEIRDGGAVVCELNVHLHHNSRGLSVGATVRYLHTPKRTRS
jgi:hypothetical protein